MQYFVTVVVFLSSFSNILILGGRCCFWFWLLWKLADSKLIPLRITSSQWVKARLNRNRAIHQLYLLVAVQYS